MSDYCIENDLPRQQELEAIRQAKIYKEKDESIQQAHRQGRKQAAKEIMMHLLGMFWTIPYKENEPMIYRDQAIEWLRDKFGLEG